MRLQQLIPTALSSPTHPPTHPELKQSDVFRHADDGRRGVYLGRTDGHHFTIASNAVYNSIYRSPEELTKDMWRRRCLLTFLYAA